MLAELAWVLCYFNESGGEERVICYASRTLLLRERNCSTIEREMRSIIWNLQKFQDYIYARHVVVETDHRLLAYLKSLDKKVRG